MYSLSLSTVWQPTVATQKCAVTGGNPRRRNYMFLWKSGNECGIPAELPIFLTPPTLHSVHSLLLTLYPMTLCNVFHCAYCSSLLFIFQHLPITVLSSHNSHAVWCMLRDTNPIWSCHAIFFLSATPVLPLHLLYLWLSFCSQYVHKEPRCCTHIYTWRTHCNAHITHTSHTYQTHITRAHNTHKTHLQPRTRTQH